MLETGIKYYERKVRQWLTAAGHYSEALDGNVFVLAGTLSRYAKALNETEEMVKVSVSSKGALQQHPAYKMQRDCEESILKQLKELRLTAEGTRDKVRADPLVDLMAEVHGKGGAKPKIVKPDE